MPPDHVFRLLDDCHPGIVAWIAMRPRRKDRQGIIHFAYGWNDNSFEPMCEVYSIQAPRSTDEPMSTVPTCVLCWAMVLKL